MSDEVSKRAALASSTASGVSGDLATSASALVGDLSAAAAKVAARAEKRGAALQQTAEKRARKLRKQADKRSRQPAEAGDQARRRAVQRAERKRAELQKKAPAFLDQVATQAASSATTSPAGPRPWAPRSAHQAEGVAKDTRKRVAVLSADTGLDTQEQGPAHR